MRFSVVLVLAFVSAALAAPVANPNPNPLPEANEDINIRDALPVEEKRCGCMGCDLC